MLRVLSLSTLFPTPAQPAFGLFVARQMEALARRGDVEVTVLRPIPVVPPPFHRLLNSPAERALPENGRDWGVSVLYPRYTRFPQLGTRWNPALIFRAVLPLAKQLHAANPFHVIDAQFFYPDGPAAARIAKALGLPLSIKARGSDIHLWGTRSYARRQMLAAARQAAGLLAVSQALASDMAALGMDAGKLAVHHTGLDRALFHPVPRHTARAAVSDIAPVNGALLVAVGNLIPLKGQRLIIEALPALPGAQLVLAGTGPEEARLRALAARLGVADRVHLAGSLRPERLALLLSAADVMVLPSEREGLANAWIEALACGTPLVITDVGGAREVVRKPSAGRLIERTPAAIAEAVLAIVEDPPSQKAAAENAATFSWEANAAQLAEHYARLAAKA